MVHVRFSWLVLGQWEVCVYQCHARGGCKSKVIVCKVQGWRTIICYLKFESEILPINIHKAKFVLVFTIIIFFFFSSWHMGIHIFVVYFWNQLDICTMPWPYYSCQIPHTCRYDIDPRIKMHKSCDVFLIWNLYLSYASTSSTTTKYTLSKIWLCITFATLSLIYFQIHIYG